jgi:hypothetical protein
MAGHGESRGLRGDIDARDSKLLGPASQEAYEAIALRLQTSVFDLSTYAPSY